MIKYDAICIYHIIRLYILRTKNIKEMIVIYIIKTYRGLRSYHIKFLMALLTSDECIRMSNSHETENIDNF